MRRLIRYAAAFALIYLLNACNLQSTSPPPTSVPQPIVTVTPTRGAFATLTPVKPNPPFAATVNPDSAVISEVYMAPHGVLSFRYPPSWVITDQSNESEILVKAETLPGAAAESTFVVNLLNATEELSVDGFAALADTYLRHLLEGEFDTMQISYRRTNDSLIATAIRASPNPHPVQFELRFSARGAFYQVLTLIATPNQWQQAFPILDDMARSVAVNKDMAAFIPTPSAAVSRQNEGLALQNASLYTAKTGALFIVGEVLNHSEATYEDVQVSVTLLDENQVELIRQPWAIERKVLPSNRRSPFVAVINQPPDGWQTFELAADALPADFYAKRISNEFEVSDLKTFDGSSASYGLMGTLKNIGQDARSVKIIGAIYNEEGNVLAVSRTTLGPHTIRSGEEVPVELLFYTKAEGQPANYEIWAEGTLIGE